MPANVRGRVEVQSRDKSQIVTSDVKKTRSDGVTLRQRRARFGESDTDRDSQHEGGGDTNTRTHR